MALIYRAGRDPGTSTAIIPRRRSSRAGGGGVVEVMKRLLDRIDSSPHATIVLLAVIFGVALGWSVYVGLCAVGYC